MMVAKKKARESEKFEVQQWVNICHQEIDRASDSGQNSTHVCFDRSVYTKLAERVATKLRRGGYSVHVIEEHQSDLGLHVTIGWPSKK
jgi:hypothetical protein